MEKSLSPCHVWMGWPCSRQNDFVNKLAKTWEIVESLNCVSESRGTAYHFCPPATCCCTVYPNWACLEPLMILWFLVSMLKQSRSPGIRHRVKHRPSAACLDSEIYLLAMTTASKSQHFIDDPEQSGKISWWLNWKVLRRLSEGRARGFSKRQQWPLLTRITSVWWATETGMGLNGWLPSSHSAVNEHMVRNLREEVFILGQNHCPITHWTQLDGRTIENHHLALILSQRNKHFHGGLSTNRLSDYRPHFPLSGPVWYFLTFLHSLNRS